MSKARAQWNLNAARRTLAGVMDEPSPVTRNILVAQVFLDIIRAVEQLADDEGGG